MTVGTGSSTGQSNVSAIGGYGPLGTGSSTGQSIVAAKSTVIELYESQQSVEILGAGSGTLEANQIAVMVLGTPPAEETYDSQLVALTLTQIGAKFEYNSQLVVLVDESTMPDVQSSQIAVLSLVRSNPSRRRLRAWTFWMDGHEFYVLHLGDLGTIVFDTVTRKWSEWSTINFNVWRANYGTNWNEDIIAGDVIDNYIFTVNPDLDTDLDDPIISVITGGFPMRLRNSITCDEVMVTSSIGMSSYLGAPTIQLRTSDDYGLTFADRGTILTGGSTPRTQISWQSLGEITAPGRIFELTEMGAAKRINSIELFSRDLKDG